MEKIKVISKDFKSWIIHTLQSGASPEAIVVAMIKEGFDEQFAYQTLLRIVANQPVKVNETTQVSYHHETPLIGQKGNILSTSDREVEVLSRIEKPFILHLGNVVSEEECNQLIELSKNRLQPSTIIDPTTGEERLATGRTSKGTYYELQETSLIATIEKRIAELTDIPIENGEGLQVLNYQVGEEYKPHFDYFPTNKVNPERGGQRIATFLIYLNDVSSGGETTFQKVGASIVPKKGNAVYFHYGNSKGEVDRLSLHSSIPVTKGEKWVATKWLREGQIYR